MAQLPAELTFKMVVLDFDKTITVKHTQGRILQLSGLEDSEIAKNFADLTFLRRVFPQLKDRGIIIAIATYVDEEPESLLSGVPLIRKYLEVAFPGTSEKFIPDVNIEAWNPENRKLDMKAIGKNMHLEELRKRIAPTMKRSEIVLIDDTDRNIHLALRKGYNAFFVEPARGSGEVPAPPTMPEGTEPQEQSPGGFCIEAWDKFLTREGERKKGGGCNLS